MIQTARFSGRGSTISFINTIQMDRSGDLFIGGTRRALISFTGKTIRLPLPLHQTGRTKPDAGLDVSSTITVPPLLCIQRLDLRSCALQPVQIQSSVAGRKNTYR